MQNFENCFQKYISPDDLSDDLAQCRVLRVEWDVERRKIDVFLKTEGYGHLCRAAEGAGGHFGRA